MAAAAGDHRHQVALAEPRGINPSRFSSGWGFFFHPEPTKPQKVDPEWEELITAPEAGRTVRLPFGDETEKRGRRLSVGRRAKGRGFSVDIRYGDGFMAVRRSDEALSPAADKPKPANGRRRRPQAEPE